VRRKDKQITDPAALRKILADALVCRIGLVDGGRPYVVPMCFALDGDDLLLHSASTGRKLEILAANPNVCFEVESGVELVAEGPPCDWGMRYRTVVGFGDATLESGEAATTRALQRFAEKYGAGTAPEFPRDSVGKTRIVRVAIKELYGKRSGQ